MQFISKSLHKTFSQKFYVCAPRRNFREKWRFDQNLPRSDRFGTKILLSGILQCILYIIRAAIRPGFPGFALVFEVSFRPRLFSSDPELFVCWFPYALYVRETPLYRNNGQRCTCFSGSDFQVSHYAASTLLLADSVGKHQRICLQTWSPCAQATSTTNLAASTMGTSLGTASCSPTSSVDSMANCSRAVLSIVGPALGANAVRTSCYITHLCQLYTTCNIEILMSVKYEECSKVYREKVFQEKSTSFYALCDFINDSSSGHGVYRLGKFISSRSKILFANFRGNRK